MPDENDIVYNQYGVNVEAIFRNLLKLFQFDGGGSATLDSLSALLTTIWNWFSIIAFLISGLLLFGIIYAKIRIGELEHHQHEELHHAEEHFAHEHAHASKNQRWEDAVHHVNSDNPNDWRLAIIEADIMLEGLLDSLGYAGLTIGDKLKQASPQFFKPLEDAWQAHKVRNEIAHKGTDFVLTSRLARETLERYRRVFEEFSII
jgi:hypothetical protein